MEKYYKLTFIVLMTVCMSLTIAISGSLARSTDKPIVVRKKIDAHNLKAPASIKETGPGAESKRPTLAPRSDLAQLKDDEEVDKEVDDILVAENKATEPKNLTYNPKGKVDPFEPLFKSTSKKEESVAFTPKTPPKGHIPGDLEKIDLSQLKLTGIVISSNRNLGLVQEASGKGYVISKGSYIGIRGGRVSDILKNKVIVKEILKNTSGRIVVQKKELKLRNSVN